MLGFQGELRGFRGVTTASEHFEITGVDSCKMRERKLTNRILGQVFCEPMKDFGFPAGDSRAWYDFWRFRVSEGTGGKISTQSLQPTPPFHPLFSCSVQLRLQEHKTQKPFPFLTLWDPNSTPLTYPEYPTMGTMSPEKPVVSLAQGTALSPKSQTLNSKP